MATVYEANDPRFGRLVAVKVLPREFMHDPEFRGRFTREAKTIATLEHPAIVPVYDFGEEDGQPFLVMRIMRGGSLTERMLAGPISIEETSQIFKRIGSALDRAHSMGIVHRDMKPSNILFDEFDEAYLADFGIVQVTSGSSDALTASGSLVGTPAYMSPEQVYGDKQLDGRSDIYALGVILFQMLTGSPPYIADTPARMMMKHVMDPVPQVLQMRPDLPDELDNIINKAMAKERDERFPKASDLSSALTAVTIQQAQPDQIQAELAAIRDELKKEATPTIKATASPSPPAPTLPATELASPITPITSQPTIETRAPGNNIPKWVIGLVALLVLMGCGAVGAFIYSSNQSQLAEEGTATAVSLAAEATKESPQATQDAIPPTPTATNTATPTPTANIEATRESTNSTRAAEVAAAAIAAGATEIAAAGMAETDAEATRASLIETRAAEATQSPPTPENVLLVNNDKDLIFGPAEGSLIHEANNLIISDYADVSVQNFMIQANFVTPYDTAVAGWDFGVTFRQVAPNNELRLVIRSDGEWNLNNRTEDNDNFVQDGDISAQLNLAAGVGNRIIIIAIDEFGYFFFNGEYIERLNLSDKLVAGDIGIGTGYYTDNQVDGENTAYNAFSIWPIIAEFGPEEGAIEHIEDGFIKTVSTDTNAKNFVMTTEFTNPYGLEVSDWDYGFSFRDIDLGEQYWFIVGSENEWDLINRVNDEDDFIQNDTLKNLDTTPDGANKITLLALEDTGLVFVNDLFLTTLDLSDRDDKGGT